MDSPIQGDERKIVGVLLGVSVRHSMYLGLHANERRLRVPSLPEYGSLLDRIQGIRRIPQQKLFQRFSRPRIGVCYGQGSALTTVVFLLGDGRRTRSRCD